MKFLVSLAFLASDPLVPIYPQAARLTRVELDKGTRALVWATLAAAFLLVGVPMILALSGIGLVAGGLLVGLALVLFAWILLDSRTRYVMRHPIRSRRPNKSAPPEPVPFVRDLRKNYRAIARLEMEGEGLNRQLRATLHEIGNGWERGVYSEIRDPEGRRDRHTWQGFNEETYRMLETKGHLVGAVRTGIYVSEWWGVGSGNERNELIDSMEFDAPKVGLPDWVASHEGGELTPLLLRLTPPKNAMSDRVSVMIEGPMGTHTVPAWDQIRLTGVIPPGTAGVQGQFNEYHFVIYPDSIPELDGQRLDDGWYGIEWRIAQGVGTAVADVDLFLIQDGVRAGG
jgi:hypothetical protein